MESIKGCVTVRCIGLSVAKNCPLYRGSFKSFLTILEKNLNPLLRGIRCKDMSINGISTVYIIF